MIRKQLLYSLIFSYVAIFITGICLYTSLNKVAIKSIEDELSKNYSATLTDTISSIDYIIEDMKRLTIEIKEKNSVKEILLLHENLSYPDYYKLVLASQDLAQINSYNSFIGDTYIYYPQFENILNRKGTYSLKVGYNHFHHSSKTHYEDWASALNGKYYEGKTIRLGGKVAYIQSIFSNSTSNYANIIILFNDQRVQELINHSALTLKGDLYVIDTKDNILFSNKIDHLTSHSQTYLSEYELEKNRYILFEKYNNNHSLHYNGIISTDIYQQKISYINKIFGLFTSFFIGIVLLGLYLICKKYEHIKQMIQNLNLSSFIRDDQKYDELDYIERAVLAMHQDLDSGKSFIQENIFIKSIYGMTNNDEEIEKYLGNKFTMSSFIMANLVLNSTPQLNNANKLNEFIIQNVFQEVLGEKYDLYLIDYYKGSLLIINFLDPYYDSLYEDTVRQLQVCRDFLEEKIDLPYILTISGLHTSSHDLSTAYKEVQQSLEYHMLFSNEKAITYDSILKDDKPYLYRIEDQISLTKYIQEGDTERALDFIDHLFESAFKNRDISLENTKKLLFDIGVTLEQVAYKLGIDSLNLDKKFGHAKKIEDIAKYLKEVISFLCDSVQEKKDKKVDKTVEAIIRYIGQHYMDNNLTVGLIADLFDMNVSYLSRFFKENMDENLLQYITKYRIDKAKKLLLETDYNLNDIAQQVGLLNNIALIRGFKKYEYMTPNEFRMKHKKGDYPNG